MKRPVFYSISLVAVLLALLSGGKFLQIKDMIKSVKATGLPVPVVSTEFVREINWQTNLLAVGELKAAQGVLVTADVAGRVSSINFESGTYVSKGDLLIEQESSAEITDLEAANANALLAKSNLDRVARLDRDQVISRTDIDNARASHKSAIANVKAAKARLAKKQIRAPFSGRLGLRQVDLGQNISAGTPIVSLQAADPMLVNFSIPQQHLGKLKNGYQVIATTDASADKEFAGTITAINSEINAQTRSVTVQGTIANPDGDLIPGMFANVEVLLPAEHTAIVVPVTSISYASYGDSVFVVEEVLTDNGTVSKSVLDVPLKATQKFVQLGQVQGDYITIHAGLSAGERVVSAGGFKLSDGSRVFLNELPRPRLQVTRRQL